MSLPTHESSSFLQITTLINHKDKPKKSERTLAAIHRVGQAVSVAVGRFVAVGEAIATENQELKDEMGQACFEARRAGRNLCLHSGYCIFMSFIFVSCMTVAAWHSQMATEGVKASEPIRPKLLSPHQCLFVQTNCDSLIKAPGITCRLHSVIKFQQISICLDSLVVKRHYTRGPPEWSEDVVVIRLEVKAEKSASSPKGAV